MRVLKQLSNDFKSAILFIAGLLGLVDRASKNSEGADKGETKSAYQDYGVNQSVVRASKNILGNDFASSPRRNRTYLGECSGLDICYFIGSIEVYNLVREASKRAGLANVHSFVRTLEAYVGGDNNCTVEIERA